MGSTGIIPAYAGSTPGRPSPARIRRDHPRIRGEHVSVLTVMLTGRGIIPAYAGSTPAPTPRKAGPWDHPRIRGEHRSAGGRGSLSRGSSPHTRGARPESAGRATSWRIIPAYAGSTHAPSTAHADTGDHPRIRGEHRFEWLHTLWVRGSSPHTRGARCGSDRRRVRVGIIPAYAGSTISSRTPAAGHGDHPRIRGEHDVARIGVVYGSGSSPHTRGALRALTAPWMAPSDHPRIRGEHDRSSSMSWAEAGSSPHTRGAHHWATGL